ncbi:hypothetical protein QYM36_014956 [Artemia franciscana]|uniref:Uncharacterized protein n=1 Tax=Artemia franciscana TaxID=6661 RepID=A0AA88HDL3_ARTSF|nr:hypothetical protein QYM36_014956 [Artemia franciscana]
MNRNSASDKETRGRRRSGFSRGSTRVDFRHGRGSQYSNREEEELMNRGFVNNQEIAGNFTVMEEAFFAIIEDLQKRLEIALKERDHCRDEIRKMIYDEDIFNTFFICLECIKYMVHSENSRNNSELVGFRRNYLTPIFEKMNNQEIAGNFTVMEEALFAIIKDLQKRLEIALKERDHCRDKLDRR